MKKGWGFLEMYDVKLCTMKCEDSKAIYVVIKVKMGHLLEGSY